MYFNSFEEISKDFRLYFIGIGGIGMSGLAKIMLTHGYSVSGSDKKLSDITYDLSKHGASIYNHHSADNISDSNVVVYSSAIQKDNPEIRKALELGIPVISRAELLGTITNMSYGIAIAGTHGKTTTSSILGKILYDASLDPNIILGGIAPFIDSNVYCGKGKYTVFEACEAYGSLAPIHPKIALITNLELDHLDYFKSLEHIQNDFYDFITNIPFYGKLYINGDDPNTIDIISKFYKPVVRFGLHHPNINVKAIDINYLSSGTTFNVIHDNKELGYVKTNLYGEHNVYNILGAVAVSLSLDITFEQIVQSLEQFTNSERRLQLVGQHNSIRVFSDYAHHPTEVLATIRGARQLAGSSSRIISIFQPHLFSRTQKFHVEFAQALAESDLICLMPIYPARETPIPGVTTKLIKDILDDRFDHNSWLFTNEKELFRFLKKETMSHDIILTLGAGDINELCPSILSALQNTASF